MKVIVVLVMTILLLLGSAGCNRSSRPSSNEQKPSVSPDDYPTLASILFQLTQADDPAKFATQHELRYTEGRVQVTIQLESGQTALPSGYSLEITSQYENLYDLMVPVSELLRLAQEPQVRSIRTPLKPQLHK